MYPPWPNHILKIQSSFRPDLLCYSRINLTYSIEPHKKNYFFTSIARDETHLLELARIFMQHVCLYEWILIGLKLESQYHEKIIFFTCSTVVSNFSSTLSHILAVFWKWETLVNMAKQSSWYKLSVVSLAWVNPSKRGGTDGVFERLAGLLRGWAQGNPEEQPCQTEENPALPNSFTQVYILFAVEKPYERYLYQAAVIMREAIFVGSMLSNSESWSNMTQHDLDKLQNLTQYFKIRYHQIVEIQAELLCSWNLVFGP